MPIHTFAIVYETTGQVSIEVTEEQAVAIRAENDNPAFVASVELVEEDGRVVAVMINGERYEADRPGEHRQVTAVNYEPRSERWT